MGLVFPAVSAIRNAARQTKCQNNLRQLALAAQAYESSNMKFPRADDGQGVGFLVPLLSYVEEEYLAERFREPLIGTEILHQRLAELSNTQVPLFHCAASTESEIQADIDVSGTGAFPVQYASHYIGITGPSGTGASSDATRNYVYQSVEDGAGNEPWGGTVSIEGIMGPDEWGHYSKQSARSSDGIKDGASKTILFTEISRTGGAGSGARAGWAYGATYETSGFLRVTYSAKTVELPINSEPVEQNAIPISSNHGGGAQVVFADGSVHFINENISLDILKVFASHSGAHGTGAQFLEKPETIK